MLVIGNLALFRCDECGATEEDGIPQASSERGLIRERRALQKRFLRWVRIHQQPLPFATPAERREPGAEEVWDE